MTSRIGTHRTFLAILTGAVALRVVVMLGYRWQLWFPDSYGYVAAAEHLRAGVIRPTGYPLLLWVLMPFHSFALITALQHLMGLGIGVMAYLLLRRNGLPGWGASLAALPVLADAYEVQLEHLVMADTLFTVLVTGALTVMLWRYQVTVWRSAMTGALLGMAALVRTVGLPLLAVFVIFLVARRVPWRVLAAAVAACALPVAAYAGWFAVDQHRLGLNGSTGIFLYSRTVEFADCRRIAPPPRERPLCPPPGMRAASSVWRPESPLWRVRGPMFSPGKDRLAGDFAARAIEAQPLDYAAAVGADLARTFQAGHPVFPDGQTYRYYLFRSRAIVPPRKAAQRIRRYGHGSAVTSVAQPYAKSLRVYQRYVHLPGVLFGAIMALGLAGIIARRRRFGGRTALPWGLAVALIVIPPATVQFDYRYVLPAVTPACVAAALAARDLRASRPARAARPETTTSAGGGLDVDTEGRDGART